MLRRYVMPAPHTPRGWSGAATCPPPRRPRGRPPPPPPPPAPLEAGGRAAALDEGEYRPGPGLRRGDVQDLVAVDEAHTGALPGPVELAELHGNLPSPRRRDVTVRLDGEHTGGRVSKSTGCTRPAGPTAAPAPPGGITGLPI